MRIRKVLGRVQEKYLGAGLVGKQTGLHKLNYSPWDPAVLDSHMVYALFQCLIDLNYVVNSR